MSGDVMLTRIRDNAAAVELLADVFDFDLSRTEPGESVRLASGARLEVIAGESAGGSFFLCGEGPRRPVLYATSEGQAGLIAADLTAAMELVIGLPFWPDCLHFSAGGTLEEMRSAASRLGTAPEFFEALEHSGPLRAALELGEPPADELLARLHASVTGTVPDHVLLGPDGSEYASLFNDVQMGDNP